MATETSRPIVEYNHGLGSVARAIEDQVARLPDDTFLCAALGSMGLSLALQLMGKQQLSNFVGHWAPTILVMGVYSKIVKVHGDQPSRDPYQAVRSI
jgi:hypothetical protein